MLEPLHRCEHAYNRIESQYDTKKVKNQPLGQNFWSGLPIVETELHLTYRHESHD